MTTITAAATAERESRSTPRCSSRSWPRCCSASCSAMAVPDFAIGLKILSDAFLKLISMIVAPIVFCVVVHGIAGAGDLKKVGRVGVKALVYFEVMTTVALVVGLAARLCVRARPRHEHRSVDARRQGAQHLCRQRPQAAGRRHRQLPPQHHPDHLVRRAGAQRRAAGAVLRRSSSASASRWSAARRASRSTRSSTRSRPCCSGPWG